MKTKLTAVLVVLVLATAALLAWRERASAPAGTATDYRNATYTIEGQRVQLVDGYAATPEGPDSASELVTRYFGNEATGDLNGDGRDDVAFLLVQDGGGSGTFFYVVAALAGADGYTGTNAVYLGDRIAPQTTEVRDGTVIVNYADRAPGEPYSAAPSLGVSKYLEIQDGQLVEIMR